MKKDKEGVDFEWRKMDGSNALTRHFYTKAEKAAKAAPKPAQKSSAPARKSPAKAPSTMGGPATRGGPRRQPTLQSPGPSRRAIVVGTQHAGMSQRQAINAAIRQRGTPEGKSIERTANRRGTRDSLVIPLNKNEETQLLRSGARPTNTPQYKKPTAADVLIPTAKRPTNNPRYKK